MGVRPGNAHYLFKLKFDIRRDEELLLAELELRTLLKDLEIFPVVNLADVVYNDPFRQFVDEKERVQDIILRLPFPGHLQAFYGVGRIKDLSIPLYRLAYCREVYLLFRAENKQQIERVKERLNWRGVSLLAHQSHRKVREGYLVLLRLVPLSTMLEFTNHIIKRWETPDFQEQFRHLLTHLKEGQYNIPVLTLGREIGDFVDMGDAKNKYLFHELHIFPGSQFPRMVRALSNILDLSSGDILLDPFNGSGTMCYEAVIMGINTIGYDINALFNKISDAKHQSLYLDPDRFKDAVTRLLDGIKNDLKSRRIETATMLLLPSEVKKYLTTEQLREVTVIVQNIKKIKETEIRNVCEVILSNLLYHISYKARRIVIRRQFKRELAFAHKRLYLYHKILSPHFELKLGEYNRAQTKDARKLPDADGSVGGIITSPPYIDAERYIDVGALSSFSLGIMNEQSFSELKSNTLGCGKHDNFSLELLDKTTEIPPLGKEIIRRVYNMSDLREKASLLYKYYMDMHEAIGEMHRVLRTDGRVVLIVAEPHFWKMGERVVLVPNSEILKEMSEEIGFKPEYDLFIPFAKGYKRHRVMNGERLVILKKGKVTLPKVTSQSITRLMETIVKPPDWRRTLA